MPSTYTPIATQTLGSAASSVTFSSISGSYTDLILIISGSNSSGDAAISVRTGNGSVNTGSVYSTTFLYGNGSSAGSARDTSQTWAHPGRLDTSLSNSIIQFLNYSNTTTNKTILSRGNDATLTMATVSLVRDTSAINIIQLQAQDGGAINFTTGSTFTLYGVKSA